MKLIPAAIAATVLCAASAHAQTQPLSPTQVQNFFQPLASQAEQAIADHNWSGIQNWIVAHLAPGATLAVKGAMVGNHGPVITYQAVVNKQMLRNIGLLGAMSPGMGSSASLPLQGYKLGVHVQDVMELPNGDANAVVLFHEAGTLTMPQGAGGQQGQDAAANGNAGSQSNNAGQSSNGVTFATVSACTLRLSTGGNDKIQIEVAACDSTTTL